MDGLTHDGTTAGGTMSITLTNTSNTAITETRTVAAADLTGVTAADTASAINANKSYSFTGLGITLTTGSSAVSLGGATAGATTLDNSGDTLVVGVGATLQVGADNDANNQIGFTIGTQTAAYLGVDSTALALGSTNDNFQSAINKLDSAIKLVNDERGNIGAKQNRLEYTSSNLMNSIQNNANSMSTIRDADFAAEAADLAKNQILVQSGTAMLAQANSLSQNVLSLIR
jgi:flagellin